MEYTAATYRQERSMPSTSKGLLLPGVRYRIWGLVKTARPHQWVKNLFVAAPLVFAQQMHDANALTRTLVAVGCFCLWSSAVYFLNDIFDVEKDRAHPLKRLRPIASGALSMRIAWLAALVAAIGGLSVGLILRPAFAAIGAAYLTLNVAYSFGLKRVAFVDVACLALGFLLRVLGGAWAIEVPTSGWLLACTTLLSALLGFGKRAHELRTSGDKGGSQRDVLRAYDAKVLNALLYTLAVLTTLTYAAYTQSPHALGLFQTRSLLYTVPFVAFGIFRFLWIVRRKSDAESPTDSMLSDRPFLLNLVFYAASIVGIIYYL
jgi:decaprenyl-phosphate phosphoribosyltransferase